MKALGSISKDFSFLEEDVRRELEALMDAASDYWDFGELVARRASQADCAPMLVFLAMYHVSRLDNSEAAERVYDCHPELPLPMPFVYPDGDLSRGGPQIVEAAIEHFQNPLASFYMLMRLYRASENGSPEETQAQDRIRALLHEHPELRMHEADFLGYTGYRVRVEGRPEDALEYHYRALELARESNDLWHQASLLTLTAEIEGQYKTDAGHFNRARELLGEARSICDSIGDPSGTLSILLNMSVYSVFRWEINEALKCAMEAAEIGAQLGRVNANNALNLAHFLSLTGDGKSALEWAKHAVKQRNGPHTHMAMAVAFMALDDVDNAQKWLDSSKELVLQQGLEPALGQWHQMYGRLEQQRGDLESAMESYKRALDIHERSTRMVRFRSCLFDMARLEVDQFNPTRENQLDEHAGPFMQLYEESIANKDLPGHEANVLMLKAELRMKQGRHEESERLIESVIEATDYPALEYLHVRATEIRESWAREGLVPARSRQRTRNR